MHEDNDPEQALLDRAKGRIDYLRDTGNVKDRQLMEALVKLVEDKNILILNLKSEDARFINEDDHL